MGIKTVFQELDFIAEKFSEMNHNLFAALRQMVDTVASLRDNSQVVNNLSPELLQHVQTTQSLANHTSEATQEVNIAINTMTETTKQQTADATRLITEKIAEIQLVSQEVAQLSKEMIGSMGVIDNSNANISKTLDSFEFKIDDISHAVETVLGQSDQLSGHLTSYTKNVGDENRRITELSSGIKDIDLHIGNVSNRMHTLTADLGRVSDSSTDIAGKVSNVAETMQVITVHMDHLRTSSDDMENISDKVGSQTEKLSDIAGDLESLASRFFV